MSELPKGWATAQLDAIADVLDFEREPINSAEREDRVSGRAKSDLFPYYGATGQVGFIDSFRSEGQRVLLGEDAAPFLDPAKDKAYLANGRFWVNNHAHVLAGAVGLIDNQFLCHQLNTVNYRPFVTGSTRLKLTSSAMKQIPIVVAPSAEQIRIVYKLEELLSGLDAGVAELKRAQKKLAQYRQSLLKAAVEGALTAEWRANNPPTETGAQLLERILQERRARWEAKQLAKFKEQGKAPPKDWQKKYAEPVQPDANDLLELPHGWVRGNFDQLFEVLSDNGKKLSQAAYAQAGLLPVIDQGAKFIGGYTDDVSLSFDGALPVIGFGDHTRRFKLIENPFVVGADGLKLISISSAWIPEFAFIACSTLDLEDRGYSRHFQFVRNASFPLPPLGEQSEIVVSVAARLKENDDISEAIELALKQSAAQRQNILKAAFSGQLVPQDPSDEPASELLARIRAERAAQQAIKKPRGRKAKEAA